MSIGLVMQKLGMTRIFTKDGEDQAVSVLRLEDCEVLRVSADSYVEIGFKPVSKDKLNSALCGHLSKYTKNYYSLLRTYSVDSDSEFRSGKKIYVDYFKEGQYVDVRGLSRGKGFAGVMKRHNFRGLGASHGVSISHRSAGSTGQCQDPGRVFKGKKMAGHLGNKRICVQNLRVLSIMKDRSLIMVKGGIPGGRGGYIEVISAVKNKSKEVDKVAR